MRAQVDSDYEKKVYRYGAVEMYTGGSVGISALAFDDSYV
jgi:hypothetical protein